MGRMTFTDCVDLVGNSCKEFAGQKKYISTGAVNEDHINQSAVEIVNYIDKPSRANLVAESGDILFAKMQGTKKTLIINDELSGNIYSTGFCAVHPRINVMTSKCLYYFLTSKTFLDQKDKYCSGATQKAITNAGLKKLIINIPPIEQQNEICKILDLISHIINLKKAELLKLDDLIKAKFLEMFGTLDNPNKDFENAVLKDLCNKITDGKHGGCTMEEGTGRYFVGAREIYDNKVHYDTAPEINVEEFEKDYKRCNVEIGDFLIVNTGATIGKSAIALDRRTKHTLLQKSVALLKVKADVLNPVFLQYCYKVNTHMYLVENASAQPNLLLSKINATRIYVPEIDMQNEFADFVHQVNISKTIVQKSLDETQMLLDSLMQKYFD